MRPPGTPSVESTAEVLSQCTRPPLNAVFLGCPSKFSIRALMGDELLGDHARVSWSPASPRAGHFPCTFLVCGRAEKASRAFSHRPSREEVGRALGHTTRALVLTVTRMRTKNLVIDPHQSRRAQHLITNPHQSRWAEHSVTDPHQRRRAEHLVTDPHQRRRALHWMVDTHQRRQAEHLVTHHDKSTGR